MIRDVFLHWMLPLTLAALVVVALISEGYAGSILRFAGILRTAGRTVGRGWSAIIRALEAHAHERHQAHCARFMERTAE